MFAAGVLCTFGMTYVYVALFSEMKVFKSKMGTGLSDRDLTLEEYVKI